MQVTLRDVTVCWRMFGGSDWQPIEDSAAANKSKAAEEAGADVKSAVEPEKKQKKVDGGVSGGAPPKQVMHAAPRSLPSEVDLSHTVTLNPNYGAIVSASLMMDDDFFGARSAAAAAYPSANPSAVGIGDRMATIHLPSGAAGSAGGSGLNAYLTDRYDAQSGYQPRAAAAQSDPAPGRTSAPPASAVSGVNPLHSNAPLTPLVKKGTRLTDRVMELNLLHTHLRFDAWGPQDEVSYHPPFVILTYLSTGLNLWFFLLLPFVGVAGFVPSVGSDWFVRNFGPFGLL